MRKGIQVIHKCDKCGTEFKFKNWLSMERHVETFHNEEKKAEIVVVCPDCGKQCNKRTSLEIHMECIIHYKPNFRVTEQHPRNIDRSPEWQNKQQTRLATGTKTKNATRPSTTKGDETPGDTKGSTLTKGEGPLIRPDLAGKQERKQANKTGDVKDYTSGWCEESPPLQREGGRRQKPN